MLYRYPRFYDYITNRTLAAKQVKMNESDQAFLDLLHIEELPPNARVLELACGTGIITNWIAEKRPDLHVIGVDIAEPMLKIAKSKAHAKKLKNVHFIHSSALTLEPAHLNLGAVATTDSGMVDMVLCAYGYSSFSDQEMALAKTLALLKKSGCYIIVDTYLPSRSLLNRLSSFIMGADMSREVWKLLERELDEFSLIKIQDNLTTYFVARGTKK